MYGLGSIFQVRNQLNLFNRFHPKPRSSFQPHLYYLKKKLLPSIFIPSSQYATIGLFGDLHFQDRGLERINISSQWIIQELIKHQVDRIVCLGDILNTREQVSVRPLSSAMHFFDQLIKTWQPHHQSIGKNPPSSLDTALESDRSVDIILGNHDINLKHSRRYSSLDALGMTPMHHHGLILHREMTWIENWIPASSNNPACHALMIPYHEDAHQIIQYLDELVDQLGAEKCSQTIVFGHLSIDGAQQNHTIYKYRGKLRSKHFKPFLHTFSGHFHHHHELTKHRVVYVGAPLQFNFGDAGDTRGIVIYNTITNDYKLIANPFGEQFLKETDFQLEHDLFTCPDPSDDRFNQKFIQILPRSGDLTLNAFERLRIALLDVGALGVTKSNHSLDQLLKQDHGNIRYPSSSDQVDPLGHSFGLESLMAGKTSLTSLNETIRPFAIHIRQKYLNTIVDSPLDWQVDSLAPNEAKKFWKKATLAQKNTLKFLVEDRLFEKLIDIGLKISERSSIKHSSISLMTKESTFHARLKRLTMYNFLGVQGELVVPFDKMNSGIWLIEGDNGAGKSTLFEAIVWCQFGEFLRSGMQKDFAIQDNARECWVRVEYDNGLVIERGRKRGRNEYLQTFKHQSLDPKFKLSKTLKSNPTNVQDIGKNDHKMEKDGIASSMESIQNRIKTKKKSCSSRLKLVEETDSRSNDQYKYQEEAELGALRHTQKWLNATLGITFEIFSKSSILGQNIISNFVSGNQEQKRQIIEDMLGLEKFNSWYQVAKTDRIQLEQQLAVALAEHHLLVLKKENLNGQIQVTESCILKKKQLLQELNALNGQMVQKQDLELDSIKKKISNHQETIQKEDRYLMLERIKLFPNRKIEQLVTQIDIIRRHLEAASSVENELATCASCGQPVSQEHIESNLVQARYLKNQVLMLLSSLKSPVIDNYQLQMVEVKSDAGDHFEMIKQGLESLDRIKMMIEMAVKEYEQLCRREKELCDLDWHTTKLENQLLQRQSAAFDETQSVKQQLFRGQFELENLVQRKEELGHDIERLNSEMEKLNLTLEKQREECSMHKFWEMAFDKQSRGAFGTIRAFVLEDIVKDLNKIIAGYMDQIQSDGQKLQVSLTSDLEIEQVYAKRSGGERKRTDLAILFSLFDLVRTQSRYVPTFLMLDEVFNALDQEGRESVAQILISLSQRLEKILIVTHTDMSSGMSIAGTCHVKMERDQYGETLGTKIKIIPS